MTENEILELLKKRHPSDAWAFFVHVRNGTGFARRQDRTADALAMGLWPSRGLDLHGFEVKCSRQDWLNELKNPAKADAVAKYCHYWWLVVADETIVQPGELPSAWGLMVAQKSRIIARTEAPRQEATPPDYLMLASILRRAQEESPQAQTEAAYKRGRDEGIKEGKKQFRNGYSSDYARPQTQIEEFEKASGLKLGQWPGGHELGLAVKQLARSKDAIENTKRSLRWNRDALVAALAAINNILNPPESGAPLLNEVET